MSEIDAYCRFHEFAFEKRIDFLFYVERLDMTFLQWIEENRPSDHPSPPPAKNR